MRESHANAKFLYPFQADSCNPAHVQKEILLRMQIYSSKINVAPEEY